MKNLLESTLVSECDKRIVGDMGYGWSNELTEDTYKSIIQSGAKFLSAHKSKDKGVALIFDDPNGGFHFAMSVQFVPQSEEGADEGSWALNGHFDESEIDPSWEVHKFTQSPEARAVFSDVSYALYGIGWRFKEADNKDLISDGTASQVTNIMMDALADYMRLNSTIDPELCIPGIVTFRSELASDKVFIGVIFDQTIKQMVKADSAIGVIGVSATPVPVAA